MRLKDREAERTDWSTEPEASFSPEEFHANECTFFLWPRYSLVSRPPGQSTATMRRTARAWRRREPEGCERANTLLPAYQRSTIVHTPLWSSFSSGVESRHLFCLLAGIALQDDVFYPSLSPIFLLAQILMRTDLGDEPDSPRRLRSNPTVEIDRDR